MGDFDLKDAGKKEVVVVLSTDAKKIKASMSNLIKSEKKLAGIMKMIDKNDSNALCEAEFEKLCRKVLKKDQSVKPTTELFHMLWSDVYRLCKDPSQTEIGSAELCVWLELAMNIPSTTKESPPSGESPAKTAAKSEAVASSAAAAADDLTWAADEVTATADEVTATADEVTPTSTAHEVTSTAETKIDAPQEEKRPKKKKKKKSLPSLKLGPMRKSARRKEQKEMKQEERKRRNIAVRHKIWPTLLKSCEKKILSKANMQMRANESQKLKHTHQNTLLHHTVHQNTIEHTPHKIHYYIIQCSTHRL